jgi:hypothetical protein
MPRADWSKSWGVASICGGPSRAAPKPSSTSPISPCRPSRERPRHEVTRRTCPTPRPSETGESPGGVVLRPVGLSTKRASPVDCRALTARGTSSPDADPPVLREGNDFRAPRPLKWEETILLDPLRLGCPRLRGEDRDASHQHRDRPGDDRDAPPGTAGESFPSALLDHFHSLPRPERPSLMAALRLGAAEAQGIGENPTNKTRTRSRYQRRSA